MSTYNTLLTGNPTFPNNTVNNKIFIEDSTARGLKIGNVLDDTTIGTSAGILIHAPSFIETGGQMCFFGTEYRAYGENENSYAPIYASAFNVVSDTKNAKELTSEQANLIYKMKPMINEDIAFVAGEMNMTKIISMLVKTVQEQKKQINNLVSMMGSNV